MNTIRNLPLLLAAIAFCAASPIRAEGHHWSYGGHTGPGHWAELEHTFTITPHLVNQFKYGFMNFGGPPVKNITQGTPQYALSASGITGLPAGQASENFPNTSFDGPNPPAGISTGTSKSNLSKARKQLQKILFKQNQLQRAKNAV